MAFDPEQPSDHPLFSGLSPETITRILKPIGLGTASIKANDTLADHDPKYPGESLGICIVTSGVLSVTKREKDRRKAPRPSELSGSMVNLLSTSASATKTEELHLGQPVAPL